MSKKIIIQNKDWKDLDKLLRFQTLWIIDLSNNLIECVKGLREFVCLGGLDLSNNKLKWLSLDSIKHLFIVDLKLHSNPSLEADAHYRNHIVDIFPRIFCLDGRFINATERVSTKIFFDKSNFEKYPIRRHIQANTFRTTSSKSLRYYGKFGPDAYEFLRRFPDSIPLTEEWDKQKIRYLCQFTVNNLSSTDCDNGWIISFTEKLLSKIDDKSNVTELYILSILLIANVEYGLKKDFIQEILSHNKINIISIEQCDSFVSLPLEDMLKTISIFLALLSLASNKPDIQKEFVSELYHAMNNLMWVKIRQRSTENVEVLFRKYKNEYLKQIYGLSRSLLAAETFMLKSQFKNLAEDIKYYGLNDIIDDATGHSNFANTVYAYKDLIGNEDILNVVLSEIRNNIDRILSSYNLQSSQTSDNMSNHRNVSARFAQRIKSVSDSLSLGQFNTIPSTRLMRNEPDFKKMDIGDSVLLGSQILATVLAVPESSSALVQVISSPIMDGRGSWKKRRGLIKIDQDSYKWSFENNFWIPEGSVGDRIFIYDDTPNEESNTLKTTPRANNVIDIVKIQLCKESISQETMIDDSKKDRLSTNRNSESKTCCVSRVSSSMSTPIIRKLVTPNSAEIFFSSAKSCLTVDFSSPDFYAQYPISPRHIQTSPRSFTRIPAQTDTSMWLGDGDYIYKKVWWHSGNPNNVKKRIHRPGWINKK